jgi:hypothetical protein
MSEGVGPLSPLSIIKLHVVDSCCLLAETCRKHAHLFFVYSDSWALTALFPAYVSVHGHDG